jgi:hypothetical protein
MLCAATTRQICWMSDVGRKGNYMLIYTDNFFVLCIPDYEPSHVGESLLSHTLFMLLHSSKHHLWSPQHAPAQPTNEFFMHF